MDLNCVTLDVRATRPGGTWSVEAAADTAADLDLRTDGNGFTLRTDDPVTVGLDEGRHVAVGLPAEEGTHLEASLNAGDTTFDLAGARIGRLEVDGNAVAMAFDLSDATVEAVRVNINAGAASMQLASGSDIGSIDLSANAGAMDVCAGPGVGLQITMLDDVAVGHNLEDEGLIQDGDVWRSPDYLSASTRIDITLRGERGRVHPEP